MNDCIFFGGGAFVVLLLVRQVLKNHDDKNRNSENERADDPLPMAKPELSTTIEDHFES